MIHKIIPVILSANLELFGKALKWLAAFKNGPRLQRCSFSIKSLSAVQLNYVNA